MESLSEVLLLGKFSVDAFDVRETHACRVLGMTLPDSKHSMWLRHCLRHRDRQPEEQHELHGYYWDTGV